MSALRSPANDRHSVVPFVPVAVPTSAFLAAADEAKVDAEARAAIEGGLEEELRIQQLIGGR